ncbi:MAG: hypothetical protein JWM93_3442 [Frankiales bacterium]|nr:hypothetical protein [Frankiales bacterium]
MAALLVAGLAPAPAFAVLAPCAKGKVRVQIGAKPACVLATRALPVPPPAQTTGSFAVGTTLGGRLDHLPDKLSHAPKEFAGAPNRFGAARALAPDIETLAKLGRGAAARPRTGTPVLSFGPMSDPAVGTMQSPSFISTVTPRFAGGWSAPTTTTSDGSGSVTTTASSNVAEGTLSGSVTVTGVTPKGADGKEDFSRSTLELTLSLDTGGGTVSTLGVTGSLGDTVKTNGPCPDSAGRVDMTGKNTFSMRTDQEHPMTGVEYIRKNTSVSTTASFHATVGDDAYLDRTTFDITVVVGVAQSMSALGGLVHHNVNVTITGHATGSVDGRSGAVTVASMKLDGTGTALGVSGADMQSAMRASLQGADGKVYEEMLSRVAADAHERMKGAEKIWREPNKCVDMTFNPVSETQLSPNKTLAIDGKILAHRDGKQAPARWKKPAITRGSLSGAWPGRSTASAPLHFTVKGASPNKSHQTFAMTTTATSRAGIATGPWNGTEGGWRVTISGPVMAAQGMFGASISSTVRAVVLVKSQTRNGVTAYYGEKPFTYSTPVLTQGTVALCAPPGPGEPTIPVYALTSLVGHADVLITPSTTKPVITVNLSMGDVAHGTLTCPGVTMPQDGLVISMNRMQYPKAPSITVPAGADSTRTVSWNIAGLTPATGKLTVTVEPL